MAAVGSGRSEVLTFGSNLARTTVDDRRSTARRPGRGTPRRVQEERVEHRETTDDRRGRDGGRGRDGRGRPGQRAEQEGGRDDSEHEVVPGRPQQPVDGPSQRRPEGTRRSVHGLVTR